MHNIEIHNKAKSLSMFDINAHSLNKNFEDLQYLLSCTKTILVLQVQLKQGLLNKYLY